MMKRPHLAACIALLAFASLPTIAVSASVTLGDRGELYIAKTGTYGDLFPDAETGIPADRPVLAVDVFAEDEPMQRLLLPDTEGPETERSPILGFESSSQTLYAIWESQREPTVSALYLSGLGAEGWSDPVEISGNIAPLKGPPQVEIMSERYTIPTADPAEGEGPERGTRTLFHIVWWEEADATEEAYYASVLLDNGIYPGWNPVLRLGSFAGPAADTGRQAQRSLLRAPSIRPGRDIRSSVIGFADATARRFVTVETRLLPPELGRIADDLRGQIIEIGRSGENGPPGNVHRKLRGQIIEIGRGFNPGVIQHFADQVVAAYDALVEAQGNAPVESLADDLRGQIIEIGSRLLTDVDTHPAASTGRVVEIRGGDAEGGALAHLIRIAPVSRLPIPPVGPGSVDVYLAEDGLRSLVSWRHDDAVLYTESVEASERPWTAPKTLVLGEGVEPGQVDAILRARVSRRP